MKKRVKLAVENSVNHNSVPRTVFKDLSNALLADESLSAGCSYLPSMRMFGKAIQKKRKSELGICDKLPTL